MQKIKTNAMRILDSSKINYNMFSYEIKKGEHIDGVEVAHQIGKDEKEVYKTLIAQGHSKNIYTGYIRGGCSPIGMKKQYKTFVNDSAKELDNIIVSAGKVGYQIQLNPIDLERIVKCEFVDIIK